MHRLFQRLNAVIIAVALCSATGAHWVILQSVAWAGMLATYAHDRPLTQAVAETFDGEHPCDLCLVIADGKTKEQKQKGPADSAPAIKKLVGCLTLAGEIPAPKCVRFDHPREEMRGSMRLETPPFPPPRIG